MATFYLFTLRSKAQPYLDIGWKLGEEEVGSWIPSCNEYQVVLEFIGDAPPPAPELER